jgi:hypothetical protein
MADFTFDLVADELCVRLLVRRAHGVLFGAQTFHSSAEIGRIQIAVEALLHRSLRDCGAKQARTQRAPVPH